MENMQKLKQTDRDKFIGSIRHWTFDIRSELNIRIKLIDYHRLHSI